MKSFGKDYIFDTPRSNFFPRNLHQFGLIFTLFLKMDKKKEKRFFDAVNCRKRERDKKKGRKKKDKETGMEIPTPGEIISQYRIVLIMIIIIRKKKTTLQTQVYSNDCHFLLWT